ncbi:Sodium/hydrogen exchanger family-domain-containing protein [Chlamydoabsidia padenii]|nr:Sodium/hydrogen exchanger family-domain-containing protein [Chlamydoabsidia padenii]
MIPNVETISIVYSILGAFILIYGLCSLVVKERLYLSEAMVAVTIGIIFGPVCANFINVMDWGGDEVELSRQFSRLAIGIQVMAAGVTLPKAYLRKELKSMVVMLFPVMITMWLVGGFCVWIIIPKVNYLESLIISACFTPTDPVLANSIVQGKFAEKRVPLHVRNLILAESGANDGLGFPFLYLATYLIQMPIGDAVGKWAYYILAYEIFFSIFIGFLVGFAARKLLKMAEKKSLIDKESFLVYAIALSLFLMGTVSLIGSDDLLACFIAGNSFTWDDWFRKETENAHMAEVVDLLLNLSIFVYIGATVPFADFQNTQLELTVWRLVVLAILVLLFRRLPIVLALYKLVPALRTWREAIFCGWFGPIGVGALFYYTEAVRNFEVDGPQAHVRSVLAPIVYFMILASVYIHGFTIPLFHIGTFASRTLTRTSMMSTNGTSNSNLQLPLPMQSSYQEKNHAQEEGDRCEVQIPAEQTYLTPAVPSPPRHSAITIMEPEKAHTTANGQKTKE